jgi:hypothetical protein
MLSHFSKYYLQLGSFHFTSLPLTNAHVRAGTNTKGQKWVYFGEMEDGSTISYKGRGILILDDEQVQVGYYEKSQINGQARYVYGNGS